MGTIENDKSREETNSSTTDTKEKVHTARQDIIELLARRYVERAAKKAEKPVQQFCENLPSDAQAIRNLPFYESTYQAIQWQRDNYLVGKDHADRRRFDRSLSIDPPIHRMPFDATTLGSSQIVGLGTWFIPSTTVKNALLPIVVSLPSGALKEPIVNATVNAIPLAQPTVDAAVKYSMLNFIKNPDWREVIKNRTNRYIGSARDGNSTR